MFSDLFKRIHVCNCWLYFRWFRMISFNWSRFVTVVRSSLIVLRSLKLPMMESSALRRRCRLIDGVKPEKQSIDGQFVDLFLPASYNNLWYLINSRWWFLDWLSLRPNCSVNRANFVCHSIFARSNNAMVDLIFFDGKCGWIVDNVLRFCSNFPRERKKNAKIKLLIKIPKAHRVSYSKSSVKEQMREIAKTSTTNILSKRPDDDLEWAFNIAERVSFVRFCWDFNLVNSSW